MSKTKYGFSGGEWKVKSPEGDAGYHVVSIGDSDEWTDVTFYGVKARENANLFKESPNMYKMLESIFAIEHERGGSLGVDGSFYYKISEDTFKRIAELLVKARGELWHLSNYRIF